MPKLLEQAVLYELNEEIIRRTAKRKNWATGLSRDCITLTFGTQQKVTVNHSIDASGQWHFFVDYRSDVLVRDLGSECFFRRAAYGIIHAVEGELYPFVSNGCSQYQFNYQTIFGMAANLVRQAGSKLKKQSLREQCMMGRPQLFRYCHELKRRWCWLLFLAAIQGMVEGSDAHKYEATVKDILHAASIQNKQRKVLRFHYSNPDPDRVQRSHPKREYGLRNAFAKDFSLTTLLSAEGLM